MYDKNRKIWNLLRGKKPQPVKILKNIDFEAKDGDRIGILGKNGHGKSSLIKVITGIYPPQSGSININGKIFSVIEGGVAISQMISARDALRMSFIYNNALDEYSEELSDEIFDFAELNDYKEIPPIQYSSGMKVRLSVSASLFQKGEIAIFDEILALTDSNFIKNAQRKMDEIWKNIDIGIYISHNIEDIRRLCNRCFVINKGEIINSGDTEEMIKIYESL